MPDKWSMIAIGFLGTAAGAVLILGYFASKVPRPVECPASHESPVHVTGLDQDCG